ncbi:MAG: hypothetical protein HOH48_03515 [Candidatus Puniceispirillum sp.]|nr:hypothetical protein [Candidatus Puniceispirillum sp.]
MTDRRNLLLQDKNIVRLTMALVAVSILVPGVLKVGPPQWLHTPSPIAEDVSAPEIQTPEIASVAKPVGENEVPALADVKSIKNNTYQEKTSGDQSGAIEAVSEDKATETAVTAPLAKASAMSSSVTTAQDQSGTPKNDSKMVANVQTPREAVVASLTKPKASKPQVKTSPLAVARNFVRVIPASHAALASPEQKEQFIKMVLPLVLASNEEIIQRRAAIRRAYDRKDVVTLSKWAKLYKLPPENVVSQAFLNNLLARADVIPVPLALAQAAIESGWGTSRFARQGNALFGQWAWQEDVGIKPLNASNKNAVVRSFPNLLGSVRAYMHNLNTHQAYQGLRDSRERLAKMPDENKANILVNHLHNYAEIGLKYVKDLKLVMRKNNLQNYAKAYLS